MLWKLIITANNTSREFNNLDMKFLIGGPLKAVCEAQVLLSEAAADFSFDRVRFDEEKNEAVTEKVSLNVPLLAIVKVPELKIDYLNIKFDMEVKFAEAAPVTECNSAEKLKFGLDAFCTDIYVKGSGSTHEEHIGVADNSAKYYVQIRECQETVPEGFAKVRGVLESAVKLSVGDDNNKKSCNR